MSSSVRIKEMLVTPVACPDPPLLNHSGVHVVVQVPATLSQRPLIAQPQADSTACGAGAYVSGDLAGDASPAAIYSAMCGSR